MGEYSGNGRDGDYRRYVSTVTRAQEVIEAPIEPSDFNLDDILPGFIHEIIGFTPGEDKLTLSVDVPFAEVGTFSESGGVQLLWDSVNSELSYDDDGDGLGLVFLRLTDVHTLSINDFVMG